MNHQLMQISNKVITGTCAALLLSATMLSPVAYAKEPAQNGNTEPWYQGGAATNQTSKGVQNKQKAVTLTSALIGLTFSAIDLFNAGAFVLITLNFDFVGIALDAILLNDAKHKKSKLSEQPGPLQAAVRQIGGIEDLEGECKPGKYKTCNEANAILDHTEVHVQTLQNAGLEALRDVAGDVLTEPEQLVGATEVIQVGFCMPNTFASESSSGSADPSNDGSMTESQKADCTKRREGHLQLVATAGVARADLGSTVSNTEKKAAARLASYAGSGKGVTANIKVLAGLDLTLAQRLNLINMLQGQQVANEAAIALHELEGLETQ